MKVRFTITGTSPLIMHNVRLADPLDPISKAMKAITSKRTKTEEDHETLSRLEFEGGLYFHDTLGPYIPGQNVEKALVEGARITKQGKKIERGVFILDNELPLIYQGPRDIDGLFAVAAHRSVMAVRVGVQRVMRTRPIFPEWTIEAEAEADLALINLSDLQSAADDAGSMVGIGDYRPRYGRFTVTVDAL